MQVSLYIGANKGQCPSLVPVLAFVFTAPAQYCSIHVVQHWSQIDEDKRGPWPEGRDCHAAVCLGFGGDHSQLLIIGGRGFYRTLDDAWILDLRSWKWREVRVCEY